MKIFLGGTCSDSKWRDIIIKGTSDLGHVEYYNPLGATWTEDMYKDEIKAREESDYLVYVVSRSNSLYTIAEVVEDSNKQCEKVIYCIYNEKLTDGTYSLSTHTKKALDKVGVIVGNNGGKVLNCINDLILYIRGLQKE